MPELLPYLIFAAGLCFGSFVTLASHRLVREEDIVFTPSRCPNCTTQLRAPDLVPVLSWLVSRASCRHCHNTIHWRYPIIELITATLFLLIYATNGISLPAILLMLLATTLMIMIVADFEAYIIPDEIHYILLPLGLAHHWATGQDWRVPLTGALTGLAIGLTLRFGYQWIRRNEGLGWGDVKFLAIVGIWLGLRPLVPFLFFSGLFGILTALIWRALGRGPLFPFGPALACALFLCVAYPPLPAAFWHIGYLARSF